MATVSAVQTISSSPVTRVTKVNIDGANQFFSVKNVPAGLIQRNSGLKVQCMAKDNDQTQKEQTKMSTRLSDLFAFSGPAPERINGRLAMIGFVSAVAVELSNGHDVFSQISSGGGTWFVGTSLLLTAASLVPLLKGISVESRSDGVMTSDAEMWNGRFAMLGLVALAVTEYVKGSTLV